jgi:Tfp pilus assembly protein PilN
MIEFNLLPDVKLQFIKAQRLKRLVIAFSTLISIVALVIFVLLLLFVDVAQKKHLRDIDHDISTNSSKLTSNTNLNKILTIQNQASSLPALEAQDPVVSRLFGYMTELTPLQASVSSLNVDYTQNTITVTGAADSLATVNQFVDTLKFTTYKSATASSTPAFSTVVLSSFGYSQGTSNAQPANYTITFSFDPTIFSNAAANVTLTVPTITTTRSITGQPTDLFEKATTSTPSGGKQ